MGDVRQCQSVALGKVRGCSWTLRTGRRHARSSRGSRQRWCVPDTHYAGSACPLSSDFAAQSFRSPGSLIPISTELFRRLHFTMRGRLRRLQMLWELMTAKKRQAKETESSATTCMRCLSTQVIRKIPTSRCERIRASMHGAMWPKMRVTAVYSGAD